MDRFDRIYRLHRILRSARHPVPRKTLEEKLECSRATVNRAIERVCGTCCGRLSDTTASATATATTRRTATILTSCPFSLDRIRKAGDTGVAAVEIDDERLDRHFAGAYGIFSGIPGNTAVL